MSSFPFLGLTAVFPGSIVYILGGLHPGADRLFYFIVTLLACLSGVEGLLMAIASLVPDFLLGMMIGSGLMVYLWRKQHITLMFWILFQISFSFGNFHNTYLSAIVASILRTEGVLWEISKMVGVFCCFPFSFFRVKNAV